MIVKYIGIPFVDRGDTLEGADCYGLVRLVYKEQLQIEIPEFLSSCSDSRAIWSDYLKQISEHWESVEEPSMYNVVAMAYDPQHPRIVTHFGLYIGDGMLLHTLQNIGSFTCRLEEYSYCIKGIYRWK